VTNLLLARNSSRLREIAVRFALGAGRGRLIRQLLTESTVLALGAGLLGIVFGIAGTRALASFIPEGIARARAAQTDSVVLAFALAATIISAVIFGVAPAWRASRVDLIQALKGAAGDGRPPHGLRNGLVVAEIALAFVLASGAGLMVQTFWRLLSVGAGYDPHNVLTHVRHWRALSGQPYWLLP
jgi:putative ABC transport system permease protein